MSSTLFTPFRLAGLELANRIVVSPMCQYSADDGCANDWHLMHLGMLAHSGAAMVIVEATHVERHGRITHGCLGLYSDDNEAALARVIAQARRMGSAKVWDSDRSLRPQGFGAASVGGCRPRLNRRRIRGLPLPPRQSRSGTAGTRRAKSPKRTWSACARLLSRRRNGVCASASTRSNCTWRTVIWRTASCRQFQTSAPTNMVARLKIACAFLCQSHARCAR